MKKNYSLVSSWFCTIVLVTLFLFPNAVFGGVKMPSFVLESALGDVPVDSEVFAGDVLLVTFFATWCSPCVQEVPNLVKLQNEFKADGFSVVAISVDDSGPKSVAAFARKKGINYPVLIYTRAILQDFGGVYGIPTSFMVNRKGEVVKKYTGYVADSILAKDIKSLL